MTDDTYAQPAHGWTCFHCGETFTTPGSARDHFGPTPDGVPGCIIKAGDERGLLMALRKAEAAREEAIQERDRANDAVGSAESTTSNVLRMVPGARSAHDVWGHLETLTGRAMSAEATLAAIQREHPELVERALIEVAGPGTYYRIDRGVPMPQLGQAPEGSSLIDLEPTFDQADFHAWWDSHGQFCRAGGGDYEKTFAFRAWEAAVAKIAERQAGARKVARATRDFAGATLRWTAHVLKQIRWAVKEVEQVSIDRAGNDLLELEKRFREPQA